MALIEIVKRIIFKLFEFVRYMALILLFATFSLGYPLIINFNNAQNLLNENIYLDAFEKHDLYGEIHSSIDSTMDRFGSNNALLKGVKPLILETFSKEWMKKEIIKLLKESFAYLKSEKEFNEIDLTVAIPSKAKETLKPENLLKEVVKMELNDLIKSEVKCIPQGIDAKEFEKQFEGVEIPKNLPECSEKETQELIENVVQKIAKDIPQDFEIPSDLNNLIQGISEEGACISEGVSEKDLEGLVGGISLPKCKGNLQEKTQGIAFFQTKRLPKNNELSFPNVAEEFAIPEKINLKTFIDPVALSILEEARKLIKLYFFISRYLLLFLVMVILLMVLLNLHSIKAIFQWVGGAFVSAGFSTFIPTALGLILMPSMLEQFFGFQDILGGKLVIVFQEISRTMLMNVLIQSAIILVAGVVLTTNAKILKHDMGVFDFIKWLGAKISNATKPKQSIEASELKEKKEVEKTEKKEQVKEQTPKKKKSKPEFH